MNTRLSKASAAALLTVVLSLNFAPAAYAAQRDGDGIGGRVGDRIVRFIRDIRNFFSVHTLEELTAPKG